MPLLAYIIDMRYSALYGTVYAVAQIAVCLAYSLGPLFGGQLVELFGFPHLMKIVGILNICYAPICFCLKDVSEIENSPIPFSNLEEVRFSIVLFYPFLKILFFKRKEITEKIMVQSKKTVLI